MAWRFRKTVRLLPGLRLNLSRGGVSTSIGGPGASLNLGKQGTRATVGLPGSGVSYSTLVGGGTGRSPSDGEQTGKGGCLGLAIAGLLGLIAITQCSGGKPDIGGNPAATVAAPFTKQIRYAATDGLRCRSGPSAGATIVTRLNRGDSVTVAEESPGWVRAERPDTCWVSAALLSSEPVTTKQALTGASGASGERSKMVAAGTALATGYALGRQRTDPPRQTRSRPKAKRSSPIGAGGGSCPCSGSSVCIGPRGGRYCITSGGNKRYGV